MSVLHVHDMYHFHLVRRAELEGKQAEAAPAAGSHAAAKQARGTLLHTAPLLPHTTPLPRTASLPCTRLHQTSMLLQRNRGQVASHDDVLPALIFLFCGSGNQEHS